MNAPAWLETISPHAMISRDELLQWLGITVAELRAYVDSGAIPEPRLRGPGTHSNALTNRCRWRVGDVRAWLSKNPEAINHAAETPMCAEGTAVDSQRFVMSKRSERKPNQGQPT